MTEKTFFSQMKTKIVEYKMQQLKTFQVIYLFAIFHIATQEKIKLK